MLKSLFVRFLLITVLPILILQGVMVYIFYERHWLSVSHRLEENLFGDLTIITTLLDRGDFTDAKRFGEAVSITLSDSMDGKSGNKVREQYVLDLERSIARKLSRKVYLDRLKNDFILQIKPADSSTAMYLKFSHKKLYSPTITIFIMWAVGSTLALILISVAFMRNQVRAILQLADAAEKFGKGQDTGKIKVSGAKEVRTVWKAFIRMKRRIYRQIYYRTQLLAHISHDLRTPLTRMRLATEFIKNKESIEDINGEIKFMENMIDEYLNFAKEEGNEHTENSDLVRLISTQLSSYNDPKIFFTTKFDSLNVKIKPHAIERAIINLVDNTLKFANTKVNIKLSATDSHWYLYVDDDGQGVPEEYHKKIFQPFFKIDQSTKGFGLGLAIVKSIIYSHGGKIKLAKSKLGGLRVKIKVPI
jgi:two-component system, OmpR family, osmolarity sensor histidine kinase EnvZ